MQAADSAARASANETPTAARVVGSQELGLRLVDTTETEQYPALKVEVTLAGRVDTIPGVLTFDLPGRSPDGVLHGPQYTLDGEYAGIYSYDPRNRAVSRTALPADAARWDSEVKLSPDATHLAYIGSDSTGSQGVVRTWPGAAVVLKTISAPQPGGDYSFNQVWWVNRDSVEFSWRFDLGPGYDPRFRFIAVYISLPAKRFSVDTLMEQRNLRAAATP